MNVSRIQGVGGGDHSPPRQATRRELLVPSLVAGCTAATAAILVRQLSIETWVMFVGFICWYTPRSLSTRNGIYAMICLWLGLLLGLLAFLGTVALAPLIAGLALPLVVFAVAFFVVALRTFPVVDNILSWFLGMVTFFAASLGTQSEGFLEVGLASLIGGFSGWACGQLSERLSQGKGTD